MEEINETNSRNDYRRNCRALSNNQPTKDFPNSKKILSKERFRNIAENQQSKSSPEASTKTSQQ
jgi:hypothetical protein